MPARRGEAFLDRPAARAIAVVCFLLAAGALAYIHREDLFGDSGQSASDAAVAACLQQRAADVDRLVREGAMTAEKAAAFRARLEPVCRAEIGAADSGLPPQPPQ